MRNKFQEYINIQITKNNINDISFLLYGILAELIFERNYFSKNSDIRSFTKEILQEDYKEYLFASRTSLYARIIKDIKLNALNDKYKFVQQANNIKLFLQKSNVINEKFSPEQTNGNKIKKKNSVKSDPIEEWRKIINSNKG
ncbi:hypothetical protein IHV12_21920 [Fictibacillus sp. 7GRE50]|uniref:hypothetical protein n=1 Tax=Fictibacillus sp. 7GRE50 TaxID=2745878 RepID=UPI0018CEB70C|nr:hypothetical protein [Fictibacillus sp. 7GRE50]MBH0167569.1 hypothetical protein [Fictibacillus sp. 7GRE50]